MSECSNTQGTIKKIKRSTKMTQTNEDKYFEEFREVYSEYFLNLYRIWYNVMFEEYSDKHVTAVNDIILADFKADKMLWSAYKDKERSLSEEEKETCKLAWHRAHYAMLAEYGVLVNSITPRKQ